MIPARYQQIVFSLILSGMMSFIISGVSTVRALGLIDGFLGLWLTSWLTSWAIAFPVVSVVAPLARRIVAALVAEPVPARATGSADQR